MRTIDLFSGCGGLSLGFQNVGFEIVSAYDNWGQACDIYNCNFNHPCFHLDLADENLDVTLFSDQKPDLIIGGPPCQDFSSAGKRDETLGRADLTVVYAQIISAIKPQMFVMENVERIQKSNVLKKAKRIFNSVDYGLTEIVLNASFCGVPQNRKRYFLIGELNGTSDFLKPYLLNNLQPKPMTVHDYLGNRLGVEYYYRHPRSYQRRGVFSIYEPSPTVRGVNRPVPKNYQRHKGDVAPVDENLRPLTTIERSYIQTFPEDFLFEGTKSNLEQMIGNAVPVKLAEYVALAIQSYLNNEPQNVTYQPLLF